MFFTKLKFFKWQFVFSHLLRKGNHAGFTAQKVCPFKDFYGTLNSFITLLTFSKCCWAM